MSELTLPTYSIAELTPTLLDMPQVECPVYHRFGPGIYIRESHAPAGTFAIGHFQKQDHVNIMLKGKVEMINEDGSRYVLEAPHFSVGKANTRKMGLVIEDMVWQNIYATEETDINKLEEMFLGRDEDKETYKQLKLEHDRFLQEEARDDYYAVLEELGITEEQIQAQVQIDDIVDFDVPNSLRLSESPIHGTGIFTTAPIMIGEFIAKGRIGNNRTILGRYTNHSNKPNCAMVMLDNGDLGLVALENISGCMGGGVGTELTIDYRQAVQTNPQLRKV